MSPIVETKRIACSAPPSALWPLLADTERLNREAGLAPMEVEALPTSELPARYKVKSRFGPLEVEWLEHPFEWQEERRFSVHRAFTKGPIQHLDFGLELTPEGSGTVVIARFEILPNVAMLTPVLRVALDAFAHKIEDAVRRFDRQLKEPNPTLSPKVDGPALKRAQQEAERSLGPGLQPPLEALIEHLERAPDHEVARIRPFALADRLNVPRRPFLEACLGATVAGLLELRFEVVCPSCRTASSQLTDLAQLEANGHCHLCDLSFGLELDRSVEASFRPAAPIRAVPDIAFCTGGPAVMPHVVAQRVLHPGDTAELLAPAAVGRYRLQARGGAQAAVELVDGGPAEQTIEVEDDRLLPANFTLAPGGTLRLVAKASARHVKLEHLLWSSAAATLHEVTTIGTFRRLFSKGLLRPGMGLKVGRVALLFSDLSASTALYAREGDAAAFDLVQAHFDLLKASIEGHDGAVVKTIGDAVMAAFIDERSAVRAAVAMQKAFPGFRAGHPASAEVFLKVGVYAGPCYAVSANGILDYFGQSVNVAARLQGQAEAAELVLPAELAASLGAEGLFLGLTVSEPFQAELKGVAGSISLVRVGFLR
ncbi:MAG: hypothetical protein IPG45_10490 [Deltaproteobacteria bacterium]|nr:hypothetical protein [Deltaproteobacteria bacterium]